MTEYVTEWFGLGMDLVNRLGEGNSPIKSFVLISEDKRREEIVRCRDCRQFYEDRRDTSIGWVDVFGCNSEQWSTSSLMPSHKVEPDGFCAWGERKEKGKNDDGEE